MIIRRPAFIDIEESSTDIMTEGLFSKMAEKNKEKKLNLIMSDKSGGKLGSADKSKIDNLALSYIDRIIDKFKKSANSIIGKSEYSKIRKAIKFDDYKDHYYYHDFPISIGNELKKGYRYSIITIFEDVKDLCKTDDDYEKYFENGEHHPNRTLAEKMMKEITESFKDICKKDKSIAKINLESNPDDEYSYSIEAYIVFDEAIEAYMNNTITESTEIPEEKVDLTKYFSFDPNDGVDSSLVNIDNDSEKAFYRDPVYNKAIMEHFNMLDTRTRKVLLSMNEAGQNSVLMSLTSKLYDKIVEKCDDIDYGDIPKTKGDITKLPNYESMKETISIMHDILKEYNQDTGPVDELSVAFSNIEARKDLFERAYRYNSELPIAMYCNITLGIITGISYMIATCIEFIKDPGAESFRIALDKMAYAKTKDHMIYNTLKSFNKTCANKDFDKAMEAVLKASTKNFGGAAIVGGIAIGLLGTILVLIPVLRELIFMFYYMRMKVSDFYSIQADLLQMNTYSVEANKSIHPDERKKIVAKQLKYVERFRKISNTFAFEIKKAEVAADKEKKNDDETKMLIDDIDGIDTKSNVSALF